MLPLEHASDFACSKVEYYIYHTQCQDFLHSHLLIILMQDKSEIEAVSVTHMTATPSRVDSSCSGGVKTGEMCHWHSVDPSKMHCNILNCCLPYNKA